MEIRATRNTRPARLVPILILCFIALLMFLILAISLFWEKNITLAVDKNTYEVMTKADTVAELLEENGIVVDGADLVEPALDTKLESGQTVTVTKAFDITVMADNNEQTVHSIPITVSQVLELAGITLGEKDKVYPEYNPLITGAQKVRVVRIEEKVITEKEAIAPSLVRVSDSTLEQGITKTLSKGKAGVKENQLLITLADGVQVASKILSSTVVTEAQPKKVAYGTITTASRGGMSFSFEKALVVSATAYTDTGYHTATGTVPKVGTIAVDPKVIPLGTKVYVEGYGFATAEDTGGSIKGNKIDVYFETESVCIKWGVRSVKIYVLK